MATTGDPSSETPRYTFDHSRLHSPSESERIRVSDFAANASYCLFADKRRGRKHSVRSATAGKTLDIHANPKVDVQKSPFHSIHHIFSF